MNVLFAHSHKFRRIGGEYYSPSGMSKDDLERYVETFGSMTFIGRVADEQEVPESYLQVSGPRSRVFDAKNLDRLVRDADGVIARIPSVNGFRAAALAKKYGKPCLLEVVVCVWDAYVNHSLHGKLLAAPAFWHMKRLVKNAERVLYVSREFLQRRYPTNGLSVGVSDVAIDLPDEAAIAKRLEKIDRSAEGTLKLGVLGMLCRRKGQDLAIRALPKIETRLGRRVELELVGPGDQAPLRKIARETGVEDRVRFCGPIPHERVFEWFDSVDLYLQPSFVEGLCRALVEALSRGLPCVASSVGGNVELVDKEQTFSMRNKRTIVDRLTDAVCAAAGKETMKRLAIKNFELVKRDFDPVRAERTRSVFYNGFRDSFMRKD